MVGGKIYKGYVMEKKYKKGEKFKSAQELAEHIGKGLPYQVMGVKWFESDSIYYKVGIHQYAEYFKLEEVQEPKKLGRLYMCKKYHKVVRDNGDIVEKVYQVGDLVSFNFYHTDDEFWQPVTIDSLGNVLEVVE